MLYRFLAIATLTTVFSCSKQEIIKETVIQDAEYVLPNNTAPADSTIENVVIESYINKLYISLLSRKPDSIEFKNTYNLLRATNLSESAKQTIIDGVMSKNEYYTRLYEIARQELLNSADTSQIIQNVQAANIFLASLDSVANKTLYNQIKAEVQKSNLLLTIESGLRNSTLTVIGMHKICVNNLLYSDINMGTKNFVISMYQNFLFRAPSTVEEKNSEDMVNGKSSIVFFKPGDSKDDFINIFLFSDDYFEGQVRSNFKRFMLREPTTNEIEKYAQQYKADLNYKNLQKSILSLSEYVGI